MMTMRRIRGIPENGIDAARELRRQGTPAEDVLWEHLRARQLSRLKFRRQHPIGQFIVDFCCPERRLVVEVDGTVHEDHREQDQARTRHLEQYGYTVIRFDNLEIVNSIDRVLQTIAHTAHSKPD